MAGRQLHQLGVESLVPGCVRSTQVHGEICSLSRKPFSTAFLKTSTQQGQVMPKSATQGPHRTQGPQAAQAPPLTHCWQCQNQLTGTSGVPTTIFFTSIIDRHITWDMSSPCPPPWW